MGIVDRFLKFLQSDRIGEGRTNSLMILVRYVDCISILLHFIFFVFLTVRGYFPANMVYLAACGLLIGIFALSYFVKRSDIIVFLVAITAYIVCIIAGPYVGWVLSGYGFMYLTLMLLWFDSSKGMVQKLILTGFIAAVICVLFGVRGANLNIELSNQDYVIMLMVDTVIMSSSISMAAYFLCKDNVADEQKLMQYNAKLKTMAGVDPLTGLMNRRAIGEKFEELLKEETQCITVAMGDIDFFKKVNDTRGHDCGDYVLKSLGLKFQEFMKDKGYVSRWGGEEFVFVFENINGDDAYPMLEQLRRDIEKTQLEFFSHKFSVTMTFGMEEYSPMFGSEEAIKKADEKLYIGKESGRNKVVY
ncbi:MAG: diguanylate cyclase [Lachnospiraceae bacterium]|nr:diguanylate cyclase [Lachnospiraceae bacterium]